MPDIMDDAQAYNELHQEISLKNQRFKARPEQHPEFDGNHCVSCGVRLPDLRVLMSRVRCVECQTDRETFQKQFAPCLT